MRSLLAQGAMLLASFCLSQIAVAQDSLNFWPAGGDHGLLSCEFVTLPTGEKPDPGRIGRLRFGVYANWQKSELVGRVMLRENGVGQGGLLLEIGAGSQALFSATVNPEDAGNARADVPVAAMTSVLRSLVRHPNLWMRLSDAAGRPKEQTLLAVAGKDEDVSWCLSILERDLAAQPQIDFSRPKTAPNN